MRLIIAVLITCSCMASPLRAAQTYFTFESSPTSWVGRGLSPMVTPTNGNISLIRPVHNGVYFVINNHPNTGWLLDMSAPGNVPLTPGRYIAERVGFQSPGNAGFSLSGGGRGNNTLHAVFDVLEADYDSVGTLLAFAADFTQYDERSSARWIRGQIRYSSTIPEPSVGAMLAIAALGLPLDRRQRCYIGR